MKILLFDDREIVFKDPTEVSFENTFEEKLYRFVFSRMSDRGNYSPFINVDDFYNSNLDFDVIREVMEAELRVKPAGRRSTNPERFVIQRNLEYFFDKFPIFVGLFTNTKGLAKPIISNAEILLGKKVSSANFIQVKRIISRVNLTAWNRVKDLSERQAGVSTLGTISETLLKLALTDLIDNESFFRVSEDEVESYGDFVLMCLPNNLWLSVKSNFSRERLLSSGYANDILGVGFFEDWEEFTSRVKIRNFQRAGFLAMYCPDVPVTEDQLENNTNTHDSIIEALKPDLPTNINDKPFFRKLSDLHDDLIPLLQESDIRKRTTVHF